MVIEAYQDSIALDEHSIIQHSFSLVHNGKVVDSSFYSVDFLNAILILKRKTELIFPIKAVFRVFPFHWIKEQKPVKNDPVFLMKSYSKEKPAENYDNPSSISYSGNFSRAVSFGNSQDAVLHSSMNLQLSGKLTEDISIRAAISDNNIPLQPSGTTNNIREFDNVMIELSMAEHKLVFGDFNINSNKKSHFLNFSKKQSGALYTFENENSQLISSYSVSRGRYHEMKFEAEEGNLGPYQLRGANGELFIVVLAGSEQVFINGELLKRGIEHDYIIDYNTGELSFTASRFISSDMRIQINFEYAERTYARSNINFSANHDFGSTEVFMNIYSEKDNKRNTIDAELDESAKAALSAAGDLPFIVGGGIDSSAFDAERINYDLTDTVVNGVFYDSVFQYSNISENAHYQLKFTYSGPNSGNYILSSDPVNGRVYRWVAPVDGVPSGDYSIGEKLFAPSSQQIFTAGFVQEIKNHHIISAEGSLSMMDDNTFSKNDDDDNTGGAVSATYSNQFDFGGSKLKSSFNYQLVTENFREVERFRQVEYQRNWNLPELISGNNHSSLLSLELFKSEKYKVAYSIGNNSYINNFNAFENKLQASYTLGPLNVYTINRQFSSKSKTENSQYFHPIGGLVFKISPKWQTEIKFDNEYNHISDKADTSFLPGSFKLKDYSIRFLKSDSTNDRFELSYALKFENRVEEINKGFNPQDDRAHYLSSSGQIYSNKKNEVHWSAHFKNEKAFSIIENAVVEESLNYYQSRIRHKGNYLNSLIQVRTDYEIGSGNELASQLTYIKVEAGKGTHAWIDDGDNIKEVDEFVVSPYEDENDHVQLMVKTTESRAINKASIDNTLTIDFGKIQSDSWFGSAISKFSLNSTFKSGRKIFKAANNAVVDIFNPLSVSIPDSSLIHSSVSSNQQLYFNRKGRFLKLELYSRSTNSKNLLNVGFSVLKGNSKGIIVKMNPSSSLNTEIKYEKSKRSNFSDFLSSDPYDISSHTASLDLSYIIGRKLRIQTGYQFRESANLFDPLSSDMISNQLSAGLSLKDPKLGSLQLNFKWAKVDYEESPENESLNFAMLNGYKPGANILWDARVNRELSKWLLLTLSYNARKTGKDSRIVHIGQAKLNVIF
ncbi:MAG: hypothetical protein HKN92_07420 [Chitinophagales bacterium]|nr:hypothetical protein [Chitinophagales bacterium]